MDGILSGFGLAGAAGLNAYIPLLLLGIASRLGYADLNAPYDLLGSNVGLGVLIVLLAIEVLADKFPGIDHVNDVINTGIRPAAGAALFLSSNGAGTLNPILAGLLGLLVAGGVHATKASARPLVTATTGGLGNPVVSFLEDLLSLFGALLAIFAPFFVGIFLLLLIVFIIVILRRRQNRRAAAQSSYATG